MKKILFVCDANNFSSGAFQFIKTLHQSEPFLLTGAFFHSVNYDILVPTSFAHNPDAVIAYTQSDVKAVAESIHQFSQRCMRSDIEYRIHEESDEFKIDDLIKESRFADCLIISKEMFGAHLDETDRTRYFQMVLHRSECPVVIVPENYKPFNRIAIAYDGKKESMFALKQFCYLFQNYTNLPTDIFYWVDKSDEDIPELINLEEFAGRHFSNLNLQELFFDPSKYLSDWVKERKNAMFICGAYGRSGLSAFFRKSFVDELLQSSSSIIFLAHNN